jgi:hypothetical protein
VTFFTLFITDVIVGTISGAAVPFATYIGANAVGMKSMAHSEFKPPVQIIKVLYQQIFLWLSLPHFPAVVPVAVLLWFIQVRFDSSRQQTSQCSLGAGDIQSIKSTFHTHWHLTSPRCLSPKP